MEPFLHSLLEQPEPSPQDPVAEPASLGGDFQMLRLAPSLDLWYTLRFSCSPGPRPCPPPPPLPCFLHSLRCPFSTTPSSSLHHCLVLWGHCWVTVGSPSASCGQRAESLMVEALEDWLGCPPHPRSQFTLLSVGVICPLPQWKDDHVGNQVPAHGGRRCRWALEVLAGVAGSDRGVA